jgi:CMP-N-acetylneuraminic acid synthetase
MVRKSLGIICARGGSKRIQKKNIINFFDKPLIAWTIEAALESKIFDRLIVSTEDDDIARIAKQYGADVPFLRLNYADDFSTISEVVVDTVRRLEQEFNERYYCVTHLMANCPIRNSQDIVDSYSHFLNKDLDFQISCFEYGWMNPWWAFKISEDEIPVAIHSESLKSRSQDLDKLYCPSGAIWMAKIESLLESQNFYGPDFRLFPISWQSAIDIDNYEDLDMARAVFLLQNLERNLKT